MPEFTPAFLRGCKTSKFFTAPMFFPEDGLLDVLRYDLIHCSVGDQRHDCAVQLLQQFAVALLDADGIVFIGIGGIQNLQAGVCGDQSLCRFVINDDAVRARIASFPLAYCTTRPSPRSSVA